MFCKRQRMSTTVNKRGSESKYVSLFADSRPDVDVTFKDPLLSRPTSHYMVGVDNLTESGAQHDRAHRHDEPHGPDPSRAQTDC